MIYLFLPHRPQHDPHRGRWSPLVFGYHNLFWETAGPALRTIIWSPP